MQCPLCVDEVLDVHVRRGVEIDVCPRCRGVWLDRGELDKLTEARPTPPPDRTPQGGAPPSSPPRGPKKDKRKRLADRLGDVLEEVLDL